MNKHATHSQSVCLLCIWTAIRLPLLLLAVYFLVPELFTWLVTLLAIHLMGTVPERLVLFLLIFAVLAALYLVAKGWRSKRGQYLLPLLAAMVLFLLLFALVPGQNFIIISIFLTTVLALNTISGSWYVGEISQGVKRRISTIFFAAAIIISEVLLLKPFLLWWWLRCRGRNAAETQVNKSIFTWIIPVLLVSGWAAFSFSAYGLAAMHRTLFPDPNVQMFAHGNFNWLELDSTGQTLYAGGHGTNYLQAYQLNALARPPQQSSVETGYAQGFALNPTDRELYIFNQDAQVVLILNADTLALKKSIPAPQVSPGDPWIVWDKFSDSIIIVSEVDEREGIPMVVLNRQSGEVLDTRYVDASTIVLHPTQPLLYMSSSKKNGDLLIYHTQQHEIIQHIQTGQRLDRMAFYADENEPELFVTAPSASVVLQFDAETLENENAVPTLFGARAMAIDPVRGLLFTGSLVTGKMEIIDLFTRQQIAQYYLGPWLRTIVVDSDAGIAYVSSHEGLFAVRYATQESHKAD